MEVSGGSSGIGGLIERASDALGQGLRGAEITELAAQRLDHLPQLGRDFLRAEVYVEQSSAQRFPDVDANDLRTAWADVIKRARLVEHHKISREELSVREHMSTILRRLQNARFMEFGDLFDPSRGVPGA